MLLGYWQLLQQYWLLISSDPCRSFHVQVSVSVHPLTAWMTFEWYNNIKHFDFLAVAGSFPNEVVVKLAAEKLKAEEGKPVDPAQVPCAPKCNTSGDSFFCKLSKRSDLRWSKTSFHILQGFWIWIQHESDRQNLVSSILNTYQYYPPNTPFLALCALAGCYRGLPWGPKQLFIMQPAFDKHTVIPPWRHSSQSWFGLAGYKVRIKRQPLLHDCPSRWGRSHILGSCKLWDMMGQQASMTSMTSMTSMDINGILPFLGLLSLLLFTCAPWIWLPIRCQGRTWSSFQVLLKHLRMLLSERPVAWVKEAKCHDATIHHTLWNTLWKIQHIQFRLKSQ